jgi:hypothetical protein
VRFAPSSDVVGLRSSPDRRRIVGVRLLRRADASAEEILDEEPARGGVDRRALDARVADADTENLNLRRRASAAHGGAPEPVGPAAAMGRAESPVLVSGGPFPTPTLNTVEAKWARSRVRHPISIR